MANSNQFVMAIVETFIGIIGTFVFALDLSFIFVLLCIFLLAFQIRGIAEPTRLIS